MDVSVHQVRRCCPLCPWRAGSQVVETNSDRNCEEHGSCMKRFMVASDRQSL